MVLICILLIAVGEYNFRFLLIGNEYILLPIKKYTSLFKSFVHFEVGFLIFLLWH